MKKIALFTFLTLLLCTSCVTKKKFMMTEAARIASIDSLQSLLTDCRNTGDQLSAQIKKLLRVRKATLFLWPFSGTITK